MNFVGILLIIFELFEFLFINLMGWFKQVFFLVVYIVIDEFYVFIGLECGVQLFFLFNRIDYVLGCQVNLIFCVVLSVMLGELEKVFEMLCLDK